MARGKASAITPTALARAAQRRLAALGNRADAEGARRFFKPRESVELYGVRSAPVRALTAELARSVRGAWTVEDALACCGLLVKDPHVEAKIVGIGLLGRHHRNFTPALLPVVKRWLSQNLCANWATVDDLAPRILTPLLRTFPGVVDDLRSWTGSTNLWVRRAAIVALIKPARKGERLDDCYAFARLVFDDTQDLMHKCTGWLLREAGRTDPRRLQAFLLKHGPAIPRTSVRYAIEHFSAADRRRLLQATRGEG